MMKIKKKFNYFIGVLIAVLLFPTFLVTSIELVTYNKGFFIQQYEKLNTAAEIGMSQSDLLRVTWELIDYIKDDRESLDNIDAEIKGEIRPVFNSREKAHMVDVKKLFNFGFTIRNYSVLGIILLSIILFFNSKRRPIFYFASSYLSALAILLVLLGVLFVLIQSNFTYYWDQFHYLFFDNDLWLLDPKTDIMIMMVPEPFFFSAVTRVIAYFSTGSVFIGALSFWIIKNAKERTNQKKSRF